MLTRQQKIDFEQAFKDATIAAATTNLPQPTPVIPISNN